MAAVGAAAAAAGAPPSRGGAKEKNQNIQVFVRLRPINARERDLKSLSCVEVASAKEIVVRQPALDNKLAKRFTFDRAFGPASKQVDVYHEVVSPLIEEVLAGYNCTVFAYGQTGTGKTHTMVGESSSDGDVPWQNDPMAGIVPRALSQLFDELRITNSEYTVRVSYLELYNEELFDLLSTSEDNSKLRIYEDVTRKGSNIVNGLEEMTVYNKNEVYKIMAKGQEKRRTASTLMNAQSSRSHTVFTIVVHMKENSPEGEELMKIGKLNLVDLAGSENISKAGTDNPSRKERARECVNINQSLLTLGRVITALVERHPHIPYRESKLTRLLQESLGGRTKTSIIATISPGHRDVEETLSTLEYAHRARNIQNKPEINQKMTKKAVLKEYSEEIDRLKRDLQASRDKNGVYLAGETYAEMTLKLEEQEKEIQEQILYMKAIKEEKDRIENLFSEMSTNLKETELQLDATSKTLDQTKNLLNDKQQELEDTKVEVEEQKHLVDAHAGTEKLLSQQAKSLLSVADASTTDVSLLHNTLEKKRKLEDVNLTVTKSFGNKLQQQREKLKEYMENFANCNMNLFSTFSERIDSQLKSFIGHQSGTKDLISEMFENINQTMSLAEETKKTTLDKNTEFAENEFRSLKDENTKLRSTINEKMSSLKTLLIKLSDARECDRKEMENMKDFVSSWKDAAKAKMLNLRNVQNELLGEINGNMNRIIEQYSEDSTKHLQDAERLTSLRKRQDEDMSSDLNKLKSLMAAIEEKHSRHVTEIDNLESCNVESLTTASNSFKGLLKKSEEAMCEKMRDTNNVVNVFDETNKAFAKGITVKIDEYNERVALGSSIDNELKMACDEASEESIRAWNQNLSKTDSTHSNIMQYNNSVINDQHEFHQAFLKRCHGESERIIPPIDSMIETVQQYSINHQSEFRNYENSMHTFKMDTEEYMSAHNAMERAFLNEEYKLYSPTGKTPMRKNYQYPQALSCTSPHERILTRYRKSRRRDNEMTTDASPLQEFQQRKTKSEVDASPNITVISLTDSPPSFIEPRPINTSLPAAAQNGLNGKSSSESDVYGMLSNNHSKRSKENLSVSSNDKKDSLSKLRPPSKRILGSKN